jgi:hypothetical protein
MPVSIRRRNGKWCTVEPDGSTIACFDTRREAIGQLVAIEANKALAGKVAIIKSLTDDDGLRYMLLITSNSYRDREGDILKSTGLAEYAAGKGLTKPEDNVLLFWHDGEPIGDIIHAEYYKSFLIEVARERRDKTINIGTKKKPMECKISQVWDFIEDTPGEWAASHGFDVIGRSKDGIIYPFDKKETSVVLNEYQANWWTLSEVI